MPVAASRVVPLRKTAGFQCTPADAPGNLRVRPPPILASEQARNLLRPELGVSTSTASIIMAAVAVATLLTLVAALRRARAEGDLDFRGTLGVSKDVPVGFAGIRLRFDLDTTATDEQVATLLKLTERYCVVLQTLRSAPPVTTQVVRQGIAT